jgi:hypothetical protein
MSVISGVGENKALSASVQFERISNLKIWVWGKKGE